MTDRTIVEWWPGESGGRIRSAEELLSSWRELNARLAEDAKKLEQLVAEQQDWARRFKLNGVTPWEWMTRAEKAEAALAKTQEGAMQLFNLAKEHQERVTVARQALQKIANWFGEFPPTDAVWPETGEPMSYGAAFGSNGERDYMREIARAALAAISQEE